MEQKPSDKQKNKLKVVNCYHSANYGGVEKHILDLASGLSTEFEMYVLCPKGDYFTQYANFATVIELYPKSAYDLKFILNLYKFLRENKIDVIHGHELRAGVLAMLSGFLARTHKRVYHVHTPFIFWQHKGLKKYFAIVINWIANFISANFFATDVVALTPYIKSVKCRYELINPAKITVIPNGVAKLDFDNADMTILNDYDKNLFYLGYVARFTAEKNHNNLVRAFANLATEFDNFRLILVGSGELIDQIKTLAKDLDVYEKIIFTGHVTELQKLAYMRMFDLMVFVSHAEGFGIALVEGMQLGVPIVCSNLPVLRDVGQNKLIYFNQNSVIDISSKIKLVYADYQNVLNQNGRLLKEQAQIYNMQNFISNYRKLYK